MVLEDGKTAQSGHIRDTTKVQANQFEHSSPNDDSTTRSDIVIKQTDKSVMQNESEKTRLHMYAKSQEYRGCAYKPQQHFDSSPRGFCVIVGHTKITCKISFQQISSPQYCSRKIQVLHDITGIARGRMTLQ